MAAQGSEFPRVRVAALVLVDGKIVLVRHVSRGRRYHLLPGGGVDYKETLEAALRREVLEETGLYVVVGRPLFISDTIDPIGSRHVINITFAAEATGGVIQPPAEQRIEAVDLVDPSELGGLDLRPPMQAQLVQALDVGLERAEAQYLGAIFTPEQGS